MYDSLVGQIVLAEWLDSHHVAGWHRDEPARLPLTCLSAGKLMFADELAITIAGHWTEESEPQRSGEMTIPASALVSVRALG